MTDEHIVKALENCKSSGGTCKGCVFSGCRRCIGNLHNEAFNLINRQKAEIERLHEVINAFEEQSHKELMDYMQLSEKYENAKSEAIKAFAERLKEAFPQTDRNNICPALYYDDYCYIIDELAEEMTEEEGGKG